MSKILAEYSQKNYAVTLYEDGTKVRETFHPNETIFIANRPESADIQISSLCTEGCSFCYANNSSEGRLANLSAPFFDSLLPGMEIAININRPIPKTKLEQFLVRMKNQKVFVSATINQKLFEEEYEWIWEMQRKNLLYGIGVSLVEPTLNFVELIEQTKNSVIHVVAGVHSRWYLVELGRLSQCNLKILILGYKDIGRGIEFKKQYSRIVEERILLLEQSLPKIKDMFSIIAFDNLALEQLNIKSMIDGKTWNEAFLGEEGFATFYINAVDQTFARSSLETRVFPIGDKTVLEMFEFIKQNYNC